MNTEKQKFFAEVRSACAVVLVLLGLLLIPSALKVRVDNRIERWIEPNSSDAHLYKEFRHLFGTDEFILAAYTGKDIFSGKALDLQLAVLAQLEAIPGVTGILGVPSVYRDIFGSEESAGLAYELLSTPFYKNFIINEDGNVAGFFIQVEPPDDAAGRRNLVHAVRSALLLMERDAWELHLIGPPVLNVALDETSSRESLRMFPVAFLCSITALLFLLRSIRATLVALLCAALTILITLGLMGLTGHSLNMISAALPTLLWVLSLSGSTHILQRFKHYYALGQAPKKSTNIILKELTPPCVLASVTTALGFSSLLLSNMAPVRELGLFAAVGTLLSLAVNLLVGPFLLNWLGLPRHSHKTSPVSFFHSISLFSFRRRKSLLFFACLLIMFSAATLSTIKIESNPLTFFPKDAELAKSYVYIDENLSGAFSLEIVINTPGGWLHSQHWPYLESLAAKLEALPEVACVLTPLDFLKKLNQLNSGFDPDRYQLPRDTAQAQMLLGELDSSGKKRLACFVAEDNEHIRLSVLTGAMDSRQLSHLVEIVESMLSECPAPLSGYHTGIVPQLVNAQLDLVQTQIRSFGLAFCVVFICLLIGLRSFALMFVSVIPNVLPIAIAFSVMALCDVPLDAATVMVASVALGIAVDDTAHLLSAYKHKLLDGLSPYDACFASLERVGPAMIITTLVTSIGFFSLSFSSFVPIRYFGLLSGLAMLTALMADIWIAPALLLIVFRERRQHG